MRFHLKTLTTALLLASTNSLLGTPDARFEIFPKDGHVISIGCESDDNEECAMQEFEIDSVPKFYASRKKYPGLSSAPKKVYDAISAAAEAIGNVEYVHVAVTLDGTTYEYMFDRDTGWNSFRSMEATKVCRLECKVKTIDNNE